MIASRNGCFAAVKVLANYPKCDFNITVCELIFYVYGSSYVDDRAGSHFKQLGL